MLDLTDYAVALAFDVPLILQGKPLDRLPWAEIDPAGPILLIALPQLLSEIDGKKRDGRLGERARKSNKMISPCADGAQKTVTVYEGPPRVDLALCSVSRINWESYQDLDRDVGDDRLVAEALHASVNEREKLFMFSHDTRPRFGASRHGLTPQRMPDHWLLDPEPGQQEKELTRLKQKIAILETDQPQLKVDIRLLTDPPFQLPLVRPLDEAEVERLISEIKARNPRAPNGDGFGVGRDYDYDRKYKRYMEQLPRFCTNYSVEVELAFGQIQYEVTISNTGAVTAADIVVEISTPSGTVHSRFVLPHFGGPGAPRPRSMSEQLAANIRPPALSALTREPDTLYYSREVERGTDLQLSCRDFRHGRSASIKGIFSVAPRAASPALLTVRLTASNLKGDVTESAALPFVATEISVSELIDLATGKNKRPFPLQDRLSEAIERKDYGWIDFRRSDDD